MSAVAGMLLFASLPPRGWWWAGVVGIGLFAAAVRHVSGWRRAGLGLVMGVLWFGPALVWVTRFSMPGAVLLIGLQAASIALAAAAVPPTRVGLLPAALVVSEWLRGAWPFGGFPLAGAALGQAEAPFVEVVTLGGPLVLVGVAAASGVAIAQFATGDRRTAAGLVPFVLIATLTGVAAVSTTQPVGAPVAVTVIQGGGPRGVPAVTADPGDAFDRHIEASSPIPAGTELIIWPENVADVGGPVAGTPEGARLSELARAARATLIAGVTEDVGDLRFRNAAIAWSPSGAILGRYDKVHRVPFGEYIPARGLLSRIVDLSLVPRDAIAGDGPGLLTTPSGPVGVAVSFEVFFPERVRAAVRAGGQLVVVPTNAASFVTDEVPAQQLAAARLRALESGRHVIQAGPTGYSAIIAPDGTVHSVTELGVAQVLTGEVRRRAGVTPYVRVGDLPIVLVALIVLALGSTQARRHQDEDREAHDQGQRGDL